MRSGIKQEYMCPHCSGINVFTSHEKSALVEEAVNCPHCKSMIHVTVAAGIDNELNVVAFEAEDTIVTR